MGGGRFALPPLSAKLLGRFSIRKRPLIAPGLNFPNMLQTFICDVTDDVTDKVKVNVKVKFLIFCPCWLHWAKQSDRIEIKPRNDVDRAWDTYL